MLVTLFLAACAAAPNATAPQLTQAPSSEAAPPQAEAPTPAPTFETRSDVLYQGTLEPRPPAAATAAPRESTPERYRAVESLLGAFHAEDLPTADNLRAHPEALEALTWLAEHAHLDGRRARAASLLGYFPEAERIIFALVADTAEQPIVRAGALEGAAKLPERVRELHRTEIVGALESPEIPVAIAAAHAVRGIRSFAAPLENARRNHPSPEVRAALREVGR